MRRYWIINPKNKGAETSGSAIEEQKAGRFVEMGWGEEDCPKFYHQISDGDVIVVAHAAHANSIVEFAGIALGKADKDNQRWNLSTVIDDASIISRIQEAIRGSAPDLAGGVSPNPWGPTKSIVEATPYSDNIKRLISVLNEIYTMAHTSKIRDSLEKSKNLILTGAPGTGKTYLARKIAEEFAGKGRWRQVQFHPSYDYTDFVEGLRPKNDRNGQIVFERKDGIFKEFCKTALDDKEHSFVFIIDEINRGDISKIFGELFYSIDPGYRGEQGKVETQYQNLINKNGNDIFKDGFYVPENVYILGTMNDIDRSVESMDFAIRRRFCWYEIKAEDTADSILSKLDPDIRETAKIKMTHMNEVIENTEGLSCAHHIGASYFLNLGKDRSCEGNFDNLWDYHLKPLIAEYLRGQRNAETKLNTIKKAYDGDESQD